MYVHVPLCVCVAICMQIIRLHGLTQIIRTYVIVVIGVTPCQLVCTSISAQQNILVIREPVVLDGTPCDNPDSSNAVCVQGTCTVRSYA